MMLDLFELFVNVIVDYKMDKDVKIVEHSVAVVVVAVVDDDDDVMYTVDVIEMVN